MYCCVIFFCKLKKISHIKQILLLFWEFTSVVKSMGHAIFFPSPFDEASAWIYTMALTITDWWKFNNEKKETEIKFSRTFFHLRVIWTKFFRRNLKGFFGTKFQLLHWFSIKNLITLLSWKRVWTWKMCMDWTSRVNVKFMWNKGKKRKRKFSFKY